MCTGDQLLSSDIQNDSFAKIENEHSLQIGMLQASLPQQKFPNIKAM